MKSPFFQRYCVEGKLPKFIGTRTGISFTDPNFVAILKGNFGWGGRIRTFTIHINSVVSYRLDHAPAAFAADLQPNRLGRLRRIGRDGGFF
jgi:hypothetical protein